MYQLNSSASPSTYGPSPSELPLFEQSASGAILLQKTQHQKSPTDRQSQNKSQQKRQVARRATQETVEQVQDRIKAEVDAARFKIAAAEAQNENERMRKLLL